MLKSNIKTRKAWANLYWYWSQFFNGWLHHYPSLISALAFPILHSTSLIHFLGSLEPGHNQTDKVQRLQNTQGHLEPQHNHSRLGGRRHKGSVLHQHVHQYTGWITMHKVCRRNNWGRRYCTWEGPSNPIGCEGEGVGGGGEGERGRGGVQCAVSEWGRKGREEEGKKGEREREMCIYTYPCIPHLLIQLLHFLHFFQPASQLLFCLSRGGQGGLVLLIQSLVGLHQLTQIQCTCIMSTVKNMSTFLKGFTCIYNVNEHEGRNCTF